MCGVLGYLGFGRPADRARLVRGLDAMAHRGPDGEGLWLDGDVALGHRRLAVMDPEGGAQPLVGCRGGVRAVVNGEFYGFEAQRAELEAAGHRFSTRSDSELLVHLYEAHGLDALAHLRGAFAFVLWDPAARRLIAARDRFGIRPLVFARDGDALWLASESAALFAAGLRAAWDEDALLFSLGLQYLPPGATPFAGVSALRPGWVLIADEQGVRTRPYWALDYPRADEVVEVPDAVDRVRDALAEAVQVRLRSDVPVASLLSGGLDSSAVASISAAQSGIEALFTVRFDAPGYDESGLAIETAEQLGLPHHVVPAPASALAADFEDAVASAEGLVVNPHVGAKRLLSRAVRAAGFKVVLSGEGADEVFAGYPHLRADLLADDPGARGALVAANPVSRGVLLAEASAEGLEGVAAALGFVPGLLRTKAALGRRLRGWMTPDGAARHAAQDLGARLLTPDLRAELDGRTRLSQALIFAARLSLAGYILPLFDDAQELGFGLEARLPFLDHHLFEVAKGLPDHWKIRGGEEKFVLREAARGGLTEAVAARRKHPFFAPPFLLSDDPEVQAWVRARVRAAPAIFDRRRVLAALDRLRGAAPAERVAAEPAISMVMSAGVLADRFGL